MAAAPGAAHDDGMPLPALVDVTDLSLRTLCLSTDSVLARSLSALVAEMSGRGEVLAAFGNFAPDDPGPI
ncbi:FXSXX-COOH protein [Actinoplanes octamycinicus]|uniref:FXSXX-COOH protein n=1 Tax=Actinoplanes octamycinicus TaxID=135948 RepID=A0A7W7GUX0_9ACTN|nr:hypothetical protein [Actinoplanes octamycinicus]MBB4738731.1 FXSXX-COOH protein [Actinoplanes octamycinicus]GIE61465.1 hypothetical protein Aoc01nite_68670 [Actinoplanes octamycinicus]